MYATRIAALKNTVTNLTLTGIDYIEVEADQTHLRVHFHRNPATITDSLTDIIIAASDISIVSTSGGEGVPVVGVVATAVIISAGVEILRVTTDQPGDFSRYRLTIEDDRLDVFFKSAEFSFKADCPDTSIDCKQVHEPCAPADLVDFPVDYMARDFLSLRGALMDFARQRYPQWRELVEADVGVMLLELMAALGDELSYTQDRMAREAYLGTATQRRSVRHLARLVDYNIHDGRSGTAFLDVQVKNTAAGPLPLPAGARVWAAGDDGASITFELGEGLADYLSGETFSVRKEWNALPSYAFDPDAAELPAGATEIYVKNIGPAVDPYDLWENKWVLLHRDPVEPGEPARRHLVRVTHVDELIDDLMGDIPLLRLSWGTEHALPWCLTLGEDTTVHGNIVPATAGERSTEYFEVRGATPDATQAVEREGPLHADTGERSVTFLHSLLSTETGGLGRLGADLRDTVPELRVARVVSVGPEVLSTWTWRHTLLSSTPLDEHYTLEDGTWRRVIGFQRATVAQDFVHIDYASGDGATIRFGDGEFAKIPADGLRFRVDYRTGPGAASNVAAGTIRSIIVPGTTNTIEPPLGPFAGDIDSISNPLPVVDGVDPESLAQIRQTAPEEFRAVTHRAVKSEDFCEIARRLDWVQVAGVRQRWTGSWPTTFVTPDPVDAYSLTDDQRAELSGLMHCVRQAGREVFVRNPRFRAVDLEVQVCVKPGHLPSVVRDAVLFRLRGDGITPGYFTPDTFTFGAPLRRLTLEAVVGAVPGVLAVREIRIGARAIHDMRPLEPLYVVPDDQILRLANDPRTPERGSIRVITEGGV